MANKKTEVKTADIVSKLVDILSPISQEDRRRILSATLTLLGEEQSTIKQPRLEDRDRDNGELDSLPAQAKTWMRQHKISQDELEQFFHLSSGGAEVIAADASGKNNKEKTLNAYVLQGLSSLLATGVATFDDKSARQLCTRLGCFDSTNHSKIIGQHGNEFTGTKDKGWTLTAPGLKHGAALIKGAAKND